MGGTKLLIKIVEKNRLVKTTIGAFVGQALENALSKDKELHPGNTEFAWLREPIQILAGQEDGSVSWKNIQAVTRHDVQGGKILEVKLKSGRIIRATKGESFVRLDAVSWKLVSTKGTGLRIGDLIAVSTKQVEQTLHTIDLKDHLPQTEFLFVENVEKIIQDSILLPGGRDNTSGISPLAYQKAMNTNAEVPNTTYDSFRRKWAPNTKQGRINLKKVQKGCVYSNMIGYYHIPQLIQLDFDFGWFCGIYAAEGCPTNGLDGVSIAGMQVSVQNAVLEFGAKWGISGKVYGARHTATILSSKVLCRLMIELFGKGSRNKHVHCSLFGAPTEWVSGFLSGYIDGDGHVAKASIITTSVSQTLRDDVASLMTIFGTFPSISEKARITPYSATPTDFYTVTCGIKDCAELKEHLRLKVPHKNEPLLHMEVRGKVDTRYRLGDVLGDKIVSIEEIDWTEKVYDFTVEGFKTFNGADGIVHYDTFHLSGFGNSAVTTGFPRLRHLLNVSSTEQNVLRIYLEPEYRYDEQKAIRVAKRLKEFSLEDILISMETHYGIPEADKGWFRHWTQVYEGTLRQKLFGSFSNNYEEFGQFYCPYVVRFEMNAQMINEIAPEDQTTTFIENLANQISEQFEYLQVVLSPAKTQTAVLLLFMANQELFSPNKTHEETYKTHMLPDVFMQKLAKDIPKCIHVSGVAGVRQVFVRSASTLDQSTDYLFQMGLADAKEFYLETDGGDLPECAMIAGVDFTRSYSNSPNYTATTFGIEAGRSVLQNEINQVLAATSHVDSHHILLITDWMCQTGQIRAFSRHTQNKIKFSGVIDRSTNEEGISVLTEGALQNRVDDLRGVSASIASGKLVRAGTGCVELLLDEDKLRLIGDTEEEEEDEWVPSYA